jgi:hypothetical protein
VQKVSAVSWWFDAQLLELRRGEGEESVPWGELVGVFVEAAADQGKKCRHIGDEGYGLRNRMRRSCLVELSDLSCPWKGAAALQKQAKCWPESFALHFARNMILEICRENIGNVDWTHIVQWVEWQPIQPLLGVNVKVSQADERWSRNLTMGPVMSARLDQLWLSVPHRVVAFLNQGILLVRRR